MGRHPAEPFFWAACAFAFAFLVVFFAVRSQWVNEHDKPAIPPAIPQTHPRYASVAPVAKSSAEPARRFVDGTTACFDQLAKETNTRCFAGTLFRVTQVGQTPKYEQVMCAGQAITCMRPDESMKP